MHTTRYIYTHSDPIYFANNDDATLTIFLFVATQFVQCHIHVDPDGLYSDFLYGDFINTGLCDTFCSIRQWLFLRHHTPQLLSIYRYDEADGW
jgi:hypothetical protein